MTRLLPLGIALDLLSVGVGYEQVDDVRCDMAQKAGEQMRQLVKTYTDIDPHELYR